MNDIVIGLQYQVLDKQIKEQTNKILQQFRIKLDENDFPLHTKTIEEVFVLQRDNIEFEFEISNIESIREKGKLILSTTRLILISERK